ncbi:hypothetical protein QA640_25150 [Bradyrhizobium sp. CB82]|uniref:hypothetical protein n=1 Tax=Bradyrhizobium sp. CB82 TaxID=3039159 RepID=UPI0024B1BA9C|nr:hypothetical protein [Bradyrhizobium sp. CB82]WFU37751.1 hypothetical protein QA640_25150 [Bradyrhizobium sp. CB82]
MTPLDFSPAGAALANYGGAALAQQREQETEEVRKRRMAQAQQRGLSPAGTALSGMGLLDVQI